MERSDGASSEGMFWVYTEGWVEITVQGTAVLGMAACKVKGFIKGRDGHGVTSDAASLMGWAVI